MRIAWSPRALADLHHIKAYISHENPAAAEKVAAAIRASVRHLAQFPSIGRLGQLPDTRELVVRGTPYIVPYRVREDFVEIVAVIHGARRWP